MTYFREYFYYCAFRDRNVARVSVPNQHGHEYYQIVEADEKGYALRREQAVQDCLEAIRAGCDPGMVVRR